MAEQDREKYPWDVVPRLAAQIHSEGFSNGERAALKRMALKGKTPLVFYRMLVTQVPKKFSAETFDSPWRLLFSAIALQHENPHDPQHDLGTALAEIGYSEQRLETLFAAEEKVREMLLLRLARRLAAQRARCNWKQFAQLAFNRSQEARERIQKQIAADYFRQLQLQERERTQKSSPSIV